jgi:hypothetical protein
MKALENIDLVNEGAIYAVANTPLYLTKKLRESEVVRAIARDYKPTQILGALGDALRDHALTAEKYSLSDYVRPFVFVAALSVFNDPGLLDTAAHLRNAERLHWFQDVCQALSENLIPTSNTIVLAETPMPRVLSNEDLIVLG